MILITYVVKQVLPTSMRYVGKKGREEKLGAVGNHDKLRFQKWFFRFKYKWTVARIIKCLFYVMSETPSGTIYNWFKKTDFFFIKKYNTLCVKVLKNAHYLRGGPDTQNSISFLVQIQDPDENPGPRVKHPLCPSLDRPVGKHS